MAGGRGGGGKRMRKTITKPRGTQQSEKTLGRYVLLHCELSATSETNVYYKLREYFVISDLRVVLFAMERQL